MVDPLSSTFADAGAPGRGSPLRPGLVVGGTYEITELLGQGGMGAVWEAKHLRLAGKRVVIKVLLQGAADEVMLARFRREAEIGSRLGHPNIVQVLDFNALPDGSPYMVLERLQGETLAARLRRGRLPREAVTSIVVQIGTALAAAHREGIVHRDLKPENVFLCPTDVDGEVRDVVKVLDFGISKMRDARTVLTQDSALMGTPQYMAPEQATGANDAIDPRTDVFAFGAMTFEMLAGRPAFSGDSLAAVVHAVVYAPTPPLAQLVPDLAPSVAAAVARALEKDREARFPDVTSFVRAITGARASAVDAFAGAATMVAPTIAPSPTAARGGDTAVMSQAPSSAGPTPSAPSSAQHATRKGAPLGKALLGLALIGALGLGAFVVLGRAPAEQAPSSPSAHADQRAPSPAPTTTPPTTAPPNPARAPVPDAPPEARPQGNAASHGGKSAKAEEALSPAAAADLHEAERALAAGKPDEALRHAQHSLYTQSSGRAYAAMARARCSQGDLGNAKAAVSKVAPGQRASVLRWCKERGIDLR